MTNYAKNETSRERGIYGFVTFEDEELADYAEYLGGLVVIQEGGKIKKVVDYRSFSEAHGEDFFEDSPIVELRESRSPATQRIILLEIRKFKSKYKESNTPKPNHASSLAPEPTFNDSQMIKKKSLANYAHGQSQTRDLLNAEGSQRPDQRFINYQPNHYKSKNVLLARDQTNNLSYRNMEPKIYRQHTNFLERRCWESEQSSNLLLSQIYPVPSNRPGNLVS